MMGTPQNGSRMRRHGVGVGLVAAAILACSFLPFLPGAYDPIAAALAFAAYVFGIVGLLLVPVGVVWLVAEVRRRGGPPTPWPRFVLPLVALIATVFVGAGRRSGHAADQRRHGRGHGCWARTR